MSIKYSALIFIILAILSSCSSDKFQEISTLADRYFNDQKYSEFNDQYKKLLKINKKEAEKYLSHIKENNVFKVDNYSSLNKVEAGIELMKQISTEISALSDYANSVNESLIAKKKYFEVMNDATRKIENHVKNLNNPFNKVYVAALFLNSFESVEEVSNELRNLSSDINSSIISIESAKVPSDFATQTNSFLDALNTYKKSLDEKYSFVEKNKSKFVSSHSLVLKGNIFGMDDLTTLDHEMEQLSSKIKTAISNLKQRAEAVQKLIQN